MTVKTDMSQVPYFDDYRESKGFLKILFKPQSLQIRELNQIQSIIQNQISRMGNNIFKEGAVVIPGGFQLSDQEVSLRFTFLTSSDVETINSYTKVYVREVGSNRRILLSSIVKDKEGDNVALGTVTATGNAEDFTVGSTIVFETTDEAGQPIALASARLEQKGTGTIGTLEQGVYYIRGYFVLAQEQKILVSSMTKANNIRVGLKVREDIITAQQDSSLYSNALGEENEKAEGANRFVIQLILETRGLEDNSEDFIELVRIRDYKVSKPLETSEYNLLEKTLAKRTFEESGDYTVTGYGLNIVEHQTFFTEEPDETKLVAVVAPATSYVKGYRVENTEPVYLTFNKARTSSVAQNAIVGINFSGYITPKNQVGIPDSSQTNVLEFLNASNQVVGTGYVVAYNSGRLYVNGLSSASGYKITDATKLVQKVSGSTVFKADIDTATPQGVSNAMLIFPLSVNGAKTLFSDGVTNVVYRITRVYEVSLASGSATISSGSSDLEFDPDFSSYLLGSRNTGASANYLNATYQRLGNGGSLQITSGSTTGVFYLIAKMVKRVTSAKSKIKATKTDSITLQNGVGSLSSFDGLRLVSVLENGNDVTSEFIFDGGQRDTHYGKASVKSKFNLGSGRTVSVTYEHFSHGNGDFFCVDSYSSIVRSERLTYQTESGQVVDLRDVIDFRPQVGAGSQTSAFPYPDTSMVVDVEYYLPRIDSIVISFENGIQILEGIPSDNPQKPSVPQNAMKLYDLLVPAYTPSVDGVISIEQDNSRFTMRDIGKLKSRIENLEYYTSLSLLEVEAMNIQAIDPITGQNRFKNGIFADPMQDFRLIDPNASVLSLDPSGQGIMYPKLTQTAVDMELVSGGVERDGMVYASYSEEKSVEQPFATSWINVNPYAVFSWNGFLSLSPATDFWVDTKYIAPKIVNETYNYRGAAQQGVFYGNWERGNFGSNNQVREVTTVQFTETNTQSVADNLISTKIIPYMRSININFRATGLRPSTVVFPFFNGENVSAYTNQSGKSKGQPIVTDSNGAVSGVFTVPSNSSKRFLTGKTNFVLVDNAATAAPKENDRTTFSSAVFESGGREDTRQQVITNVRKLGFTQRTTEEYRRYDPVAQSFAIDTNGGEYLSAVEVFFYSKSDNIPVTLEIRSMENGLPTHSVLSRKILNPSQVSVSSNCSTPTKFTLNHPIYLEKDVEYCLVVLANTQDYNIGYAELGQKVLGTGYAVAKQLNMGVMFTSANGSTWTPHQNRDLKFNLYRCKFVEGEQQLIFRNKGTVSSRVLGENPISGVLGESVITIALEAHGLVVGDEVTIVNSEAGLGLDANEINGLRTVSEVVDSTRFKVNVPRALTATGVIYQPLEKLVEVVCPNTFTQIYTNCNVFTSDLVNYGFEFRTKNKAGSFTQWFPFNEKSNVLISDECRVYNQGDFEIRATTKSTKYFTPTFDLFGFTTVMNGFVIADQAEPARCSYVTSPIVLANPSTKVQFYLNAMMRGSSSFKAYIQTLDEENSPWVEVKPKTPIINDNARYFEYQFEYETINLDTSFASFRIKFEFFGSPASAPMVKDIRGVSFA